MSGQLLKLCKDDGEWRRMLDLRRGLDRLARAKEERGRDLITPEEQAEIDAKMAAWRAKRAVDRKEQAQADDAASRPGYRIQPGGRVTFLPEEGEAA